MIEPSVVRRRGVDVILNLTARRLGNGSELRESIVRAARRAGACVHETRDVRELDDVARSIAARGTGAVVLAGGDGSYMAGVTALARAFDGALPPVGLAPGGTVCTVARNVTGRRGRRGGAHAWAERVVDAAVAAAVDGAACVERRPTLRVRDDSGGDRVGFIFGTGLVARFFDVYYAEPRPGIAAAARIAARAFAGSFTATPFARRVLCPVACGLEVDGAPRPGRAWTLVLASVVRDVGLGVRATYRAGEALDRFHVVASALPPRALGLQVPRVLTGRAMHGRGHVDALAGSLRVAFDEPTGRYVLDGDVLRAREVCVEPGPVIPLLSPASVSWHP
jgi:diacylglycerol kinase (ATP)